MKKIIHHHFPQIPSTNDYAKEHCGSFEREALTIITADEQTQGRGKWERKWFSPKGVNLTASFCFFADKDAFQYTRLAAECLLQLLLDLGLEANIKWPNDLQIKGKKVAGILTEQYQGLIIIGIGLNVNMTPADLENIDQAATSLFVETGKKQNVDELLKKLTEKLTHAF